MAGMRFVTVPEGRIRVRESGEGRRSVVFTADPPNVLEHYSALFARLKRDVRVSAFELPGFGHSKRAKGIGLGLEEQSKATISLLDALGGGPHVLAFPCVAAYGALRVAHQRPDLVSGLVLIQAPSWAEETKWVARVDRGGILRAPLVGQAVGYLRADRIIHQWYEAALADPTKKDAYAGLATEALDHGGAFPLAGAFQALFRAPAPALPPPACPVLSVWGGQDRTHRKSDPASVRELAPGAAQVVLEEAGHFPELEAPARFVETLLGWLDAQGL